MAESFLIALITTLVGGVVIGSLYAVASMGVAIVWGTVKVLNFAQGALITLGGYLAWFGLFGTGFAGSYLLAFLFLVPVMFLVGIGMDRLIIRPIRRTANWGMTHFIATLGAAITIENLVLLIFGPNYLELPPMVNGGFNNAGIYLSYQSVINLAIAVGTLVIIAVFVKSTKAGMAMRAVSEDPDAASLVGINVNRIYTLTLGIGTVLGGIGGAVLANSFTLTPTMGNGIFLIVFVIIVFGGLGSMNGTIVASFLVGLIQNLVAFFMGPFWTQPILFGIMIVILLIKPTGLFGVREAVT